MLALPTKGAWRPDFAPVPNFLNVLASSMDRRSDLRFRLLNFFERTGTVVRLASGGRVACSNEELRGFEIIVEDLANRRRAFNLVVIEKLILRRFEVPDRLQ